MKHRIAITQIDSLAGRLQMNARHGNRANACRVDPHSRPSARRSTGESPAGGCHHGETTVMLAGEASPMPLMSGRYMSSTVGGGTTKLPGDTARTR